MYRPRSTDAHSPRWRLAAVGAFAVLIAIRAAPVLLADFPLGDGGLFAVMAADLRHAEFTLPRVTSYNDGTIPFVYPPFGIYLLALIPGDPVQTERWLPLVFSYLATGAAFLLARSMAGLRVALVTAAAVTVMPITWAIQGGGVVRGLGFALLLLTLWRVKVMLDTPTIVNAITTGLVGAAALLSHPAVGPVGVVSSLLFLTARPSRLGAVCLLVAASIAALAVAPWVLAVVSMHGIRPWLRGATAHLSGPRHLAPADLWSSSGPRDLRPYPGSRNRRRLGQHCRCAPLARAGLAGQQAVSRPGRWRSLCSLCLGVTRSRGKPPRL